MNDSKRRASIEYKDVSDVCHALFSQGKAISVRTIREKLGGGSNNTILEFHRRWQKERELSTAVDDDLSAEFKQAVLAECARKLTTVRDRLLSQIDGREKQINETQELLREAETQAEALGTELEHVKSEVDAKLLDYEKKLAAAQEQVTVRTEYANELMKKTENQISELREQLKSSQEAKHQAEIKAATAEARNTELEKQLAKIDRK